jgi:hypothetical protein
MGGLKTSEGLDLLQLSEMVWHNCFEQTTGMLTEDIQWLRCVLC